MLADGFKGDFARACVVAALIMLANPARATAGAVGEGLSPEEIEQLYAAAQQIVVTDERPRHGLTETRSATKTATPLIDIPQSVDVISQDAIDDLSMRSVADVVRFTPGVSIGQGEGHRDQITIRGANTTADFYIDGVRDDIQYYRGLYNLERIEVLKGPNALIFGRGGGGGVVNRVLKRPMADDFASVSASVDTFGGRAFEVDANASASRSAAARLNAIYEAGRNHRDSFASTRKAVNPVFRAALGPDTRLDLAYEFAADERVVDRGVPSQNGRPLAGFRDDFFGDKSVNRSDFSGHYAAVDLSHAFSEKIEANAKVVYANFDKSYRNLFPATAVTTNLSGERLFAVEAYEDSFARRNFFAESNVVAKIATGPLHHTILAGAGFGDQRTHNARVNGFFDSGVVTTSNGRRTIVPLADPFAAPPVTFRSGVGNRTVFSEADVVSVYAQSQTKIGEHVELIGGARWDRFSLALANVLSGERLTRKDSVVSPRVGAVLKPVANASLYASYSRSFLPQSGDQFVALDATLAALEPEQFENLEVGAKFSPTKNLGLALAAYRLDRDNTRAPGPTPGSVALTGAQRSRGLEFSVSGSLTDRWTALLAYALQDAEIVATTAAAPAGRKVGQAPRHAFSVWSRYELTSHVGLGVAVQHQSKSFASITNAVILPAYTRLDAALFLKLNDAIEAQLNAENILNADYFPSAHNDNNISTGAPASVRFTLKARL
jgi:catecholate siderophore receptor